VVRGQIPDGAGRARLARACSMMYRTYNR
jgi:hypothetical protein